MQECRVCGLLFLGGGACPSCGSQVAIDITTDDIVIDDDSIPGLDDVVEAMGSDEDTNPNEDSILPFGMGAKAEVIQSSLPFGVGSFSEEVHEVINPIFKENLAEIEVEKSSEEDTISEGQIVSESEPESELNLSTLPGPVGTGKEEGADISYLLDEVDEPEPVALAVPDAVVFTDHVAPNAQTPLTEETASEKIVSEIVRLVADNEPISDIIDHEINEQIVYIEDSPDVFADEAPELWRIDAAAVDMDAIYAQDEQIIEVSFDDDLSSGDVEVKFDNFHHSAVEESMASDESAPELHPARALPVSADGQPEIAEMIQAAFVHMGNSSWIQAVQILSSASSNRQNDSSILNNLGLALLQSALEMDSSGDSMASSQYEAAIMALRQGAKADTGNDTLLLNLAHALLVSGRAEKALNVISVLRERTNANVEIENVLGACLIQLERKDEARKVLSPYSEDEIVSANLGLI